MTEPRYIVVYKRSKGSTVQYVGPFVSERLAEEFAATLDVSNSLIRPVLSREQVARLS